LILSARDSAGAPESESAQSSVAFPALCTPPRVQGVTLRATNVHRAREEVHDHIAAAEDGDSYDGVQDNFSQSSLIGSA
jgi:hypothetical protein